MQGFQLLAGDGDPLLSYLESVEEAAIEAENEREAESESDEESIDGEQDKNDKEETSRIIRARRIRRKKQAAFDDYDLGDSDFYSLDQRGIEVLTVGSLCPWWWTGRAMCQASSTSFGQIKILAPSIRAGHELRPQFDLVSSYGNFARLLPSGGNGGEDSDDGSDGSDPFEPPPPPLELSNEAKRRFHDLLIILGDVV